MSTVVCIPTDALQKHHCCANCAVSPGALRHHQLSRLGDQESEEQRKGTNQGNRLASQKMLAVNVEGFFVFVLSSCVEVCEYLVTCSKAKKI